MQSRHPEWEITEAGFHKPVEGEPFDVVISCDENSVAPQGGLNLCIFHGMASKGMAFSTARRTLFADTRTVFAVPGPRYESILLDMGVPEERVFVAGLTKWGDTQRNILFAPTHNPELSAIPVIKNDIYKLSNVRVQLHAVTSMRGEDHDVKYRNYYPVISDSPVMENLRWADTVIGDFGSIIVEAIALGKQAIQVVNPRWEEWYLQKGLARAEIINLPEVWYPRRYAIQVHSMDEIGEIVNITPRGNASDRVIDWLERNL
jgi:hypothetical protein